MGAVNWWMQKVDLDILFAIQNYLQSPFMDKTMVFITRMGDSGLIWIFLAVLMLISNKYRREGALVLIALLLANVLGEVILKNIIARPRPFELIEGIKLIIDKPLSYSFPSGHTASSFAAATILAYTFKKFSWCFYTVASLIAFSRLYLFVHNPTDILGGILLGIASGLVVKYINNTINANKSMKSKDE